ncbi:sialidase family protein [Paenibacillus eucommiae]|uniref:exo-alpha-sialidase n=1 Tax=Paenibacillus eucommiae TaxID=1355755 RepID=A0ABS4ISX5_9BACL|nr:sialidase family protein [Paenibacillus eucommiae]MBP1990663.1 Neuraminidase (sialidase) [Paenibacillus eucommiae]
MGTGELRYQSIESDMFVGRRGRLKRYLICSLQGFFPVLVQTGSSSLSVVYRTGAPHVGISGTLAVSNSNDGGKSWSDPVEVAPRYDDVRNPAYGVNNEGHLVLGYWEAKQHIYEEDQEGHGLKYVPAAAEDERYKVAAMFTVVSKDGGKSWSEPVSYTSKFLTLASPYGRIITSSDGTLYMSVYGTLREPVEGIKNACILVRSTDGGVTWGDESLVAMGFNETSYAFLPDGTLFAAARNDQRYSYISTLFSKDNGRTWSEPVQITRDYEHPADVTVLQSGKLLLTFGRRVRPYGCGALLSEDGGQTWNRNEEVLLAGDGAESLDVGYPSTVQIEDGTIITALYYASGSDAGGADYLKGWGKISCQAIHYREEQLRL